MVFNQRLINIGISALVALAFVHFYLKGRERTIEQGFEMVSVLCSSRDITPRTALEAEHLAVKKVPRRYVEPQAIEVEDVKAGMRFVEGKIAATALPVGRQITQNLLQTPSLETTGIAPLLQRGKRGYVLRLGNLDVAKVIYQGDYLDILATVTVNRGDEQSRVTATVLQNVLVLGVGKEIRRPTRITGGPMDRNEGLVLTLAVDPMEAQKLALAQVDSQGEMNVLVRPKKDLMPVPVSATTKEKILQ